MGVTEIITEMANWQKKLAPVSTKFKYSSFSELILVEGELLSKEPFTEEEKNYLLNLFDWFNRPAKNRSCFDTAANLCMLTGSPWATELEAPNTFEYGEGQALCDIGYGEGQALCDIGFPVEHAVFVLNGKPVDIVWREDVRKGERTKAAKLLLKRAIYNQEHNEYYMIRFPIEYMMRVISDKGTYGVIEFNRELFEKGKEAWQPTQLTTS